MIKCIHEPCWFYFILDSPKKRGISFHKFPTDRSLKKKWEVVLRMAIKSSKTSLVCSEHFLISDFVKTKKCDYTYSLNILYCIYNIVYCLIEWFLIFVS